MIDEGNILLRDAFFNPSDVIEIGIDPILKGLASNVSQEIDTALIDDVRNFLFGPPGAGGFDLAALNIQRGRDHGLDDYNSVRVQLGLDPAESFADISSDLDVQARLEEAYGTVDDIDVWVGALAEDHVEGGSLGELASTVLIDQFTALRDGDRFWYENVFEGQELRELQQTKLSDVIERNTDLTSIQDNAFFVSEDSGEDHGDEHVKGHGDDPVKDHGEDHGDRLDDADDTDRGSRQDDLRSDGQQLDGKQADRGSELNGGHADVGDIAVDETVDGELVDRELVPPPRVIPLAPPLDGVPLTQPSVEASTDEAVNLDQLLPPVDVSTVGVSADNADDVTSPPAEPVTEARGEAAAQVVEERETRRNTRGLNDDAVDQAFTQLGRR